MRKATFVVALIFLCVVGLKITSAEEKRETVTEFLEKCAKDGTSCNFAIVTMEMYDSMNPSGTKSICPPDDLDASRASVVQWLGAHPNVHPESSAYAITESLKALYPCR